MPIFFTPSLGQIYCQSSAFFNCPCMVSWLRDIDYQTHWQRLLLWFQDPIQLFCSVFHICFFILKCQGGGVWWGTECACLWLNVVETPPPLTDGWLLPVCITYPALILLPMKRKFKQKTKMLICIHRFVGYSYIACYFWKEMLSDGRKHSVVDFKGFFKLPCQL